MDLSRKIKAAQKRGFVYSGRDKDSVVLKHPRGHVLAIDKQGNIEGLLKSSAPITDVIIEEGKLRSGAFLFSLITAGFTFFTTDITIVSGHSMEPTLHNMQFIIRSKFDVQPMLKRGSIIKFRDPTGTVSIKRIIAMPGETVKVDRKGLSVDGKLVDPRIKLAAPTGQKDFSGEYDFDQSFKGAMEIKLTNDQYYVMGDEMLRSIDSRSYGPIDKSAIISVVVNDK